jgi:hypothetical protein
VIDFNDAKQEVTICMYRCLLRYKSDKATFVAYFRSSVERLMSRFYYSYFHSININQRAVEVKDTDDDESTKPSFDWLVNQNKDTTPSKMRLMLTDNNQRLFDLYFEEGKINEWLISKKLNISRLDATRRLSAFKKELAVVADIRIH